MSLAVADTTAPADVVPEWEVLLCLAGRRVPNERLCRARRILCDGIDWSALVDLARRHHVAPLLREQLRALPNGVVPPAVHAQLDRQVMDSAARSMVLVSELGDITGAMKEAGVRVLAYKGPVVSVAAYGSPLLRPIRDLDLLIHPRDFRAAEGLLVARGYRRVTGVLFRPLQRVLEYQCCFARDRDGALVELHWTLMPRNICVAVGLDELWERRSQMLVAGRAIPCLGDEDRLLSLCVHGAKHRWSRLEWIACIAALVRTHPPDWEVLLRRAGHWRVQRMLRLSLLVAGALLDPPIPDLVQRWALEDREAVALADDSLRRLPTGPAGAEDEAELRLFHLRAQDRERGRVRYHVLSPVINAWRGAAQLSTLRSPFAP